MKTKKFEISTIEDIVKCTDIENIDNFLEDLKNYLITCYTLDLMIDLTGSKIEYPKNGNKKVGFTWIDDGKNDFEINFNEK